MAVRNIGLPGHGTSRRERGKQGTELQRRVDNLTRQIDALHKQNLEHDHEIDGLQILTVEKKKPWYRSVETMVSVLTFMFSIITVLFSTYWTLSQNEIETRRLAHRDDIENQRLAQDESQSARADLRILLQRLYELQTRYYEEAASGSPSTTELSAINSEMRVLAAQAMEATDRIDGGVSTTEYLSVAIFLAWADDVENAERMYEAAIDAIETRSDYVSARRMYGDFLMITNPEDLEQGRTQYQMALNVGEIYPFVNPSQLTMFQADIEVAWAGSELMQRQCEEVRRHLQRAEELNIQLNHPSTAMWHENLRQMIDEADARIQQCSSTRQ